VVKLSRPSLSLIVETAIVTSLAKASGEILRSGLDRRDLLAVMPGLARNWQEIA